METVTDFIFLGSKITVHRHQKYMNQKLPDLGWTVPAAMKLKDNSALRENYDQPRQHVKKQRHHFADKCLFSQSYGFSMTMYRFESWTIKKTEHWRIDALELWCWRRLLRVPWIARSNQSILKDINPEYSLEGLMLKLKLQYFGHIMRRADSLEKILILGMVEGKRRRSCQRMRWLEITSLTQWAWLWANSRR